jgi:PP-loop superfamily ATP-utilizing enzyme
VFLINGHIKIHKVRSLLEWVNNKASKANRCVVYHPSLAITNVQPDENTRIYNGLNNIGVTKLYDIRRSLIKHGSCMVTFDEELYLIEKIEPVAYTSFRRAHE